MSAPHAATAPARLDLCGAFVAAACAVHCAALPFLLGSLGALGLEWLASERIGWAVLAMSLALVLSSLVPSFRRHRKLGPLALVLSALPAFALAEAGALPRDAAALSSALGGGLVAMAHLRNRVLQRDA